MPDFHPTDAINRCWLKIDSIVHQEPDYEGPMSYEQAQQRILHHYDASVTIDLIDADDRSLVIPGGVTRGNLNAPYYSTLRELLTAARNVAMQGAGVFEGEDDDVRDQLIYIAGQVEQTLTPIR